MKPLRWSISIVAAIIVVGSGWFGVKHYRCKQRNEAFARRIESIKQDAREQLKIGTKKADVARFFYAHGIPFELAGSEAIGTLITTGGCAPLGCGTDRALIDVRMRIDTDGTTTDEPVVMAMYVDCL